MRLRKASQVSLIALCVTLAPSATIAAAASSIDVAAVPGTAAVRVSGNARGNARLQAELSATFAPDLPTVFLSRRPVPTDAAGRFDAIIPIAPAFFGGTIITVIVRTATGLVVGRGSIRIAEPDAGTSAHG